MSAKENISAPPGPMSQLPSPKPISGFSTTRKTTPSSFEQTLEEIGRILVDNGSSADVLTWQCFVKMGLTEKNLHKSQYPLIGFGGKRIEALGKIELNVTFGEGNTQRTELISFDVVAIAYPYNAIFGRNSIIKFAAVINQTFLCMKIPTAGGVITILGNQEEARRCKDNAACARNRSRQQ